MTRHILTSLAGAAVCVAVMAGAPAADAQQLEIPKDAIALEGTPTVRIDTTLETTTRRPLGPAEAAEHRLQIQVKDGQLFWASREGRPLRLERADEFTYLTAEPGKYIKVTWIDNRLSYVEHVDTKPFGSITWWGELRVVLPQPR